MCFVGSYVAFVGLFFFFLTDRREIPFPERPLLLCFAYCAPFMVVRFIYSILPDFDDSLRSQFQPLIGNVTAFLCMAVLEEIFIVACFVFVGMRLNPLPPELKSPPLSFKVNKKRKGKSEMMETVETVESH